MTRFLALLSLVWLAAGPTLAAAQVDSVTSFQEDFALGSNQVRHFQHEVRWPARADTADVEFRRRWQTRERLIGTARENNVDLYVTSVSVDTVTVDTSFENGPPEEFPRWLTAEPMDYRVVYSVMGNVVYRNREGSLSWRNDRSKMIEKWSDPDRLGRRPPLVLTPPYQPSCRMKARVPARSCLLASDANDGSDTSWSLRYVSAKDTPGDTDEIRTLVLKFRSGQEIVRRYQGSRGVREEITRAGWWERRRLIGVRNTGEDTVSSDRSERRSNPDRNRLPEPNEPAAPSSPSEGFEVPEPREPNEPVSPDPDPGS
jgi:hypothetical protein